MSRRCDRAGVSVPRLDTKTNVVADFICGEGLTFDFLGERVTWTIRGSHDGVLAHLRSLDARRLP